MLVLVGAMFVCQGPVPARVHHIARVRAVLACGHKLLAMPPAMGLATKAAFVWAQIKLGLVGGWP